MNDPYDTVDDKVAAIWKKMSEERCERIGNREAQIQTTKLISKSLENQLSSTEASVDVGFHLTDWMSDAAFLLAIHLYPEEFTSEEIEAGLGCFLIHVPNHVFAAAKFSKNPVSDIFSVGDSETELDTHAQP